MELVIHHSRVSSYDRWSLLFVHSVLEHAVHLYILDESLHALADVGHLEDLGGRGTVSWVLSHQFKDKVA